MTSKENYNYVDSFRQEAEERLAEMEEVILLIENNPQDLDAINRLFRAAHTIKGSGAMFGFDDIANFTHHLESVLEKVRDRVIPVTKEIIDQVLAARDQIIAMLRAADNGAAVDAAVTKRIIARLKALLPAVEGDGARPAQKQKPAKPSKKAPRRGSKKIATYRIVFRVC